MFDCTFSPRMTSVGKTTLSDYSSLGILFVNETFEIPKFGEFTRNTQTPKAPVRSWRPAEELLVAWASIPSRRHEHQESINKLEDSPRWNMNCIP
ncbi:uncharacterized protein LOC105838165 isoform X1 [Monomorium pharaonis]|uniref:uncharacterized protein LOC105838165 isoform X1 n=1 Tax=Monomorium pharaonis TaxID=307658 RepID=UPI00063F81DA|nr:uncharacterized protein LOC105838165 isoform X1 [Monomorium pharaonis]